MNENKIRFVDSHSYIYEVNRNDLNRKSKVQSPERVDRSKNYPVNGNRAYMDNDAQKRFIEEDKLILRVPVGDYICTVQFDSVLNNLISTVSGSHGNGNVTMYAIRRALLQTIDSGDLKIHCTCDDWRYRFAYWATKYDYNAGTAETRPAKIRNPNDSLGSMCKHLIAVLKNKDWLEKVAKYITLIVRDNTEYIRDVYDLEEYEFFFQESGSNIRYGNKPVRGKDWVSSRVTDIDGHSFDTSDESEDEDEKNIDITANALETDEVIDEEEFEDAIDNFNNNASSGGFFDKIKSKAQNAGNTIKRTKDDVKNFTNNLKDRIKNKMHM